MSIPGSMAGKTLRDFDGCTPSSRTMIGATCLSLVTRRFPAFAQPAPTGTNFRTALMGSAIVTPVVLGAWMLRAGPDGYAP